MFGPPQNLDVEALTLNVMVFGGGLWEVIRSRFGHESGALMMGLVSIYEEEKT